MMKLTYVHIDIYAAGNISMYEQVYITMIISIAVASALVSVIVPINYYIHILSRN